jgi:hypothetical protein
VNQDDVRFTLTVNCDATLSIKTGESGNYNYVKPGVSSSITWGKFPTDDDVRVASQFLRAEIVEPILDEVISESAKRIREINQ